MKYGQGFWCVENGVRLPERKYPATEGFEYLDGTGDVGEFLLRNFSIDYLPCGWMNPLRMEITGNLAPILNENAFDFDFASVPRLFRTMVCDKADHRIRVASLFHDIGYCVHEALPGLDRGFWDELLVEVSEAYDMPWLQRKEIYAAVRVGGAFAWPKNKAEIERYRKMFSVYPVPL